MSEGKKCAKSPAKHVCIQSSIRTQQLCAEDFFYQLQHTELTAAAETLAGRTQKTLGSCQHQSSLPEQGRDFQSLGQQWVSKATLGLGRMELPSQPRPHRAPLQTQSPDPHTWGGRGQHAAPAPGVGMGCQEAIHGSPCLTALKLSERSHCLRQDAAAWMNSGKARRQGKAGPSKTSSQDQEQGHAVLLEGFFLWSKLAALEDQGGKDWEWQCRASDSHSGFAATFAISREQKADSKRKGEDLPATL